jgi:Domain of unknown function (DUF4383)
MATRYFALIYGILFLLVGIVGFIPGLKTPMDIDVHLAVDGVSGRLLGLFPINSLHNIVHLAFGVWGVLAYRTFPAARLYGRSVAIIYGVLTIMGLIPVLNTTFGLIPLYSHDIWLHAVLAIIAAYFGFAAGPATEQAGRPTITQRS